jgi:hypothetical protein
VGGGIARIDNATNFTQCLRIGPIQDRRHRLCGVALAPSIGREGPACLRNVFQFGNAAFKLREPAIAYKAPAFQLHERPIAIAK